MFFGALLEALVAPVRTEATKTGFIILDAKFITVLKVCKCFFLYLYIQF